MAAGTSIVRCSKCKKSLFYLDNSYKMACKIKCIECGSSKKIKKKKKVKVTAAGNYALTKGGIRKDIHPTYYFRSATEANFARILQYIKATWAFEERVFTFDGYKNKPHMYIMDFEVKGRKKLPDGIEQGWIEIKGYMNSQSRSKLRRLKKHYPDEFAKTTVIVYSKHKKKDIEFCKKLGYKVLLYDVLTKKYKPLIPKWEG